jgi:hypothetical protein
MSIFKVYLFLSVIHNWIQHMIYKHYIWSISLYKVKENISA